MAKKQVRGRAAATRRGTAAAALASTLGGPVGVGGSEVTIKDFTSETQVLINNLKKPMSELAAKFAVVRETCAEIAPKMNKLFRICQDEKGDSFTFVSFCRLFDPTMPTHAATRDGIPGYRENKTYYSALYMKRLAINKGRPASKKIPGVVTDLASRALATLLLIVPAPQLWEAVKGQMGLDDNGESRLRNKVRDALPLREIKASGPRAVTVGRIIEETRVPAPAVVAEDGSQEVMTQRGARVRRAV